MDAHDSPSLNQASADGETFWLQGSNAFIVGNKKKEIKKKFVMVIKHILLKGAGWVRCLNLADVTDVSM